MIKLAIHGDSNMNLKLHQCIHMSRLIRLIALSNLVYKNKTESEKDPHLRPLKHHIKALQQNIFV